MYFKSALPKQLAGALLAIGLTAASSAIAAQATLSSSVTGIGEGGPRGSAFGTLPQGVDYTLNTTFTYDTDQVSPQIGGGKSVSGQMAITLIAGDQTLTYISPERYNHLSLSQSRIERADGFHNALNLYTDFTVTTWGEHFEVWQSISWRDGTLAPTDLLTAPQSLNWGDYKITTSLVARYQGERGGELNIAERQGFVTVSMVPEPSEVGMLTAGLAIGAVFVRRRRTAGTAGA
ncbi:PEP-CTERM sorting domain-containing protein [Pseudoduganella armeniaca]|uniref:PEP-CTERM sorting domain-containing protein n=1 Tax=Pseudoduganella armeniaca TaxID=2072590 RepID=A0A2R4CFH6_9BURK|nr:PEP-CTERM sorting domain-containing protein [Pseudoduganella armeniaca]AVR98240.1 hypothetical protein C9I28_23305 [Pseudoduganella armeniaca]